MALLPNQNIIRLDVSMDVVELVDSLDSQHGFCHVELSLLLGEDIFFHEKPHQVAAG